MNQKVSVNRKEVKYLEGKLKITFQEIGHDLSMEEYLDTIHNISKALLKNAWTSLEKEYYWWCDEIVKVFQRQTCISKRMRMARTRVKENSSDVSKIEATEEYKDVCKTYKIHILKTKQRM